jgi:hypothetical protein
MPARYRHGIFALTAKLNTSKIRYKNKPSVISMLITDLILKPREFKLKAGEF